jgi:hypothetical protein
VIVALVALLGDESVLPDWIEYGKVAEGGQGARLPTTSLKEASVPQVRACLQQGAPT